MKTTDGWSPMWPAVLCRWARRWPRSCCWGPLLSVSSAFQAPQACPAACQPMNTRCTGYRVFSVSSMAARTEIAKCSAACCLKTYSRDECSLERKSWFIQDVSNLGEGCLVSKSQLQRFCLTMNVFKGRLIWGGGIRVFLIFPCADFLLIGQWWGRRFQESGAQP